MRKMTIVEFKKLVRQSKKVCVDVAISNDEAVSFEITKAEAIRQAKDFDRMRFSLDNDVITIWQHGDMEVRK